jgi:signal transduction histidine kinase
MDVAIKEPMAPQGRSGDGAVSLENSNRIESHSTHSVQFYQDETFFIDELTRFIGTALVAGDATVVIATKEHRDGLAQGLRSRGFDVRNASDRFVMLDASETLATFMRDGRPDAGLFTETIGALLHKMSSSERGQRRHVSAFGEMVALLWAQGNSEGAIRLEQLWNNLAETHSFSLRCAYPISGFDRDHHSAAFIKICEEHSRVIPVESYTALISEEERFRIITNLQQKAQALENEIAERKQVEENLRRTKAELEETVEHRTSTLRQLSARLLSLQDIERRRIARELHDGFGQYLVGLKLNIDMLRESPQREELWAEVEQLMQQCISEVRTLSYLLHPPTMDEAGFVSAARWYVEGFAQRSGVKVTLEAPDELDRLPDAVELALFRVLQEALTNVHRHSGASHAQVLIVQDDQEVRLEVKDNGRGMPKELLRQFYVTGAGMGVGLAGIRERARELGGKLKLEADNTGTLLGIAIPHSNGSRKKG